MVSAVVIASGQSTRLGDICKSRPKCLLPFGGVPFLRYLLFWLIRNGVDDILVTGSRISQVEMIKAEVEENFASSFVRVVVEDFPKSTVHSAYVGISRVRNNDTLLLTADNIWDVNLKKFIDLHIERCSSCSSLITTRAGVPNFGMVKFDQQTNQIFNLYDRENLTEGMPASTVGLYALKKDLFLDVVDLKSDVYVERETMQRLVPNIWGIVNNDYFFDFGTPDNFKKLSDNPEVLLKYFGNPT